MVRCFWGATARVEVPSRVDVVMVVGMGARVCATLGRFLYSFVEPTVYARFVIP